VAPADVGCSDCDAKDKRRSSKAAAAAGAALITAAKVGDVKLVEACLRKLGPYVPRSPTSGASGGGSRIAAAAVSAGGVGVHPVNWRDGGLGWTPLHWAVFHVREDVVTALLRHPAVDLEARDRHGCTPLHWAAYHSGHDGVGAQLLLAGCQVNSRNDAGAAPLHMAAGHGNEAGARMLLTRYDCDPNAADSKGCTPLHVAAAADAAGVARLLLAHSRIVPDAVNADGITAAEAAACNAGLLTLAAFAHPAPCVRLDRPLYWAAFFGRTEALRLLVQRCVAVGRDAESMRPAFTSPTTAETAMRMLSAAADETTASGGSPLVLPGVATTTMSPGCAVGLASSLDVTARTATARGPEGSDDDVTAASHHETVVTCRGGATHQRGRYYDVTLSGSGALHAAIARGHTDAVKLLAACAAVDVNARFTFPPTSALSAWAAPTPEAVSPLQVACLAGSDSAVAALLARRDCTAGDAPGPRSVPSGNCRFLAVHPLWLAYAGGHLGILSQMMRDARFDATVPVHAGRPALYWAAFDGDAPAVTILLSSRRAPVNDGSGRRHTPLHAAAAGGHRAALAALLRDARCDVNATEGRGNTPLHLALRNHPSIDATGSNVISALLSVCVPPTTTAHATADSRHPSRRLEFSQTNDEGLSVVDVAVLSGSVPLVEAVVAAAARQEDEGAWFNRALMWARRSGRVDMVHAIAAWPSLAHGVPSATVSPSSVVSDTDTAGPVGVWDGDLTVRSVPAGPPAPAAPEPVDACHRHAHMNEAVHGAGAEGERATGSLQLPTSALPARRVVAPLARSADGPLGSPSLRLSRVGVRGRSRRDDRAQGADAHTRGGAVDGREGGPRGSSGSVFGERKRRVSRWGE